MKRILFSILYLSLWAGPLMSQSVERDVIAGSGDYFEGAGISLSWTLGELATDTYSNGNTIITQGFQQPDILRIYIDLTAFLEGPFNGTQMNTALNNLSMIPLTQPYNAAPWNYAGTESVAAIPNNQVVDWVLIEGRDAPSAAVANASTTFARQAAFVLADGSVVGLDGSSPIQFNYSITNQLFVVVFHRNHLAIMSANALNDAGGIFSYDFTTAINKAYLSGQKAINGKAELFGGDVDASGIVNDADKAMWSSLAGAKAYLSSDVNMDAQVDNKDKNDVWVKNVNEQTKVPE